MTMFSRVGIVGKWRPWQVLGLAAVPLVGLPVGYVATGAGGGTAAIAAALADPLAVFAARSPGQRGAGALAQTKHNYARSGARGTAPGGAPHERVLANVRTRPTGAVDLALPLLDIPGFVADPDLGPVSPAAVAPGVAVADFAPAPTVGPGIGSVSLPAIGSGGTGAGGSGGGGGGGDGGGGTGVVQPAAPGVPEPTTWLTMLAGVFAIAWSLRHRANAAPGYRKPPATVPQR